MGFAPGRGDSRQVGFQAEPGRVVFCGCFQWSSEWVCPLSCGSSGGLGDGGLADSACPGSAGSWASPRLAFPRPALWSCSTAQHTPCKWLHAGTGCPCVTRPQSGVLGSLTSQEVPVPTPAAPPCPCQPWQGSPSGSCAPLHCCPVPPRMLQSVFPSRGSRHVAQAGLQLPCLHEPPASASQGADCRLHHQAQGEPTALQSWCVWGLVRKPFL